MHYKNNNKVGSCKVDLIENDDDSVCVSLYLKDNFRTIEKCGENYFQVLQAIRKDLEAEGIDLLCNGTSVNVYPSAMQLGMGGGDRAYRLKMGFHTQMEDVVEIFEYDEDNHRLGSVAEQIQYYERWVLSKKKMKVDSSKYSISNIGLNAQYLFFWGHTVSQDGKLGKSCLSQWWPCKFEKDGIIYSSTEQWMMAEKARVFSDFISLAKILNTDDPKEVKSLGRKVKFFESEVWDLRSYDAVKEGNYLKFSQIPELREYLLGTGDAIIVEASPYDKIWGIGMRQDDEGIEDPKKWQGQNLLGFALMEVRDHLKKETWGHTR